MAPEKPTPGEAQKVVLVSQARATSMFFFMPRPRSNADFLGAGSARRSVVALYPRGELFLADDNHTLIRLTQSGARKRLLSTFLRHGLGSPEMEALLRELESYRWTEG